MCRISVYNASGECLAESFCAGNKRAAMSRAIWLLEHVEGATRAFVPWLQYEVAK